ncbi:hypothetical protein A7K94_0212290 [Modestobacter sp. VKM Ac-2676]|nr:hypothetical protein A7K94_0212290 [Modestobacter sp. VKM Ac-2676]
MTGEPDGPPPRSLRACIDAVEDSLGARARQWRIAVHDVRVVGREWPLVARVSASNATTSIHLDVELEEMTELQDGSIQSWAEVSVNQILALVDEELHAKGQRTRSSGGDGAG